MSILFAFLKSPLGRSVFMALALVIGLYGIYAYGKHTVQVKWDAETARIEKENKDKKDKSDENTKEVVIKYVDKIKEIKVKGDTIIEYKYITVDDNKKCILPLGFVKQLDAALAITSDKKE